MRERLANLHTSPLTVLGVVCLTQSATIVALDPGLGIAAHVVGSIFLIPAFLSWWFGQRRWASVALVIWFAYTAGFYLRLLSPTTLDALYTSLPGNAAMIVSSTLSTLPRIPVWVWFVALAILWVLDRYRYLPLPEFSMTRTQRLRAAIAGIVSPSVGRTRQGSSAMEPTPAAVSDPPATAPPAVREGIEIEPYIMQGALAHEARIAVISWDNRTRTVVARAKIRLVAGETIEARDYSGAHTLLWVEPQQGMESTLAFGQRAEFAFAVVGYRSSLRQHGVAFRVKVWHDDSERDAVIARWTVGQFTPARIEVDIALLDAKSDEVLRLDRYSLHGDDGGGCHFEHAASLSPDLARVLSLPDA